MNCIDRFLGFIRGTFPMANIWSNPITFSDVHLRFELGGEHPNGSEERVLQAAQRAQELFSQFFLQDDLVTLIVNEWGISGDELWPTEPKEFLNSLIVDSESKVIHDSIIEPGDDEVAFRQRFLETPTREINSKRIFEGIANREQGRTPCLNEAIYFVSTSRKIAFYMYDDRGCLIFANAKSMLAGLYRDKNAWLVDYYRERFDAMFSGEPA